KRDKHAGLARRGLRVRTRNYPARLISLISLGFRDTLEMKLAEQHRVYHNLDWSHSSLGYLTPAEFAALDGPQVRLPPPPLLLLILE
ncbi:MAG: hypothetical protein ACC667_12185, partial [Longimicrobiales bacterium]